MLLTTFTREELIDMRADARAEYQAARNINDVLAMRSAFSDMNAISIELGGITKQTALELD
jgi:hypothetical protein